MRVYSQEVVFPFILIGRQPVSEMERSGIELSMACKATQPRFLVEMEDGEARKVLMAKVACGLFIIFAILI